MSVVQQQKNALGLDELEQNDTMINRPYSTYNQVNSLKSELLETELA